MVVARRASAGQTRAAAPAKAAEAAMPKLSEVPAPMVIDYLTKLFVIGDVNGDGVLSPMEFADLLGRSGFNLRPEVILKLLREADTTHDNEIDYEEFIPAMLQLQLRCIALGRHTRGSSRHVKVG